MGNWLSDEEAEQREREAEEERRRIEKERRRIELEEVQRRREEEEAWKKVKNHIRGLQTEMEVHSRAHNFCAEYNGNCHFSSGRWVDWQATKLWAGKRRRQVILDNAYFNCSVLPRCCHICYSTMLQYSG